MAPYTYIQCPCSDHSALGRAQNTASKSHTGKKAPDGDENTQAQDDEHDHTFDPRSPRSNYSLYPIEYLLYCEDCQQIRCPRCVTEEIVTYYCPSCLFEVPSSNIKSEGNRCTRSCFQCPICIGPLAVTSLEKPTSSRLAAENAAPPPSGPYYLTCSYCAWSSSEIDIKFDKQNGIFSQLAKIRNGGRPRISPKERKERRKESISSAAIAVPSNLSHAPETIEEENEGDETRDDQKPPQEEDDEMDIETQFANLKSFYQSQLTETSTGGVSNSMSALGDLGYSSPGSLSRIMSLYTGGSSLLDTRRKTRVIAMREAINEDEGLRVLYAPDTGKAEDGKPHKNVLDEQATITSLRDTGWDGTATTTQRSTQAPSIADAAGHCARFQSDLRPVPVLLRTKRSKRCSACRHIITKPEAKVASTRFRIRLVASNYIPTLTARYLSGGGLSAVPTPSWMSRYTPGGGEHHALRPLEPVQYVLTFKNPIFEAVRVSLATPAVTPGRFASTVTLLCPQFEIGANTDVWDEALKDGGGAAGGSSTPTTTSERRRTLLRRPDEGQAEAGKIWERGRNWVSVVVEVVPPSLRVDLLGVGKPAGGKIDRSPLREDEDLLEIPIFVRVEWEAEPSGDGVVGQAIGREKDVKEKRELAYWCVVGIGRIKQDEMIHLAGMR